MKTDQELAVARESVDSRKLGNILGFLQVQYPDGSAHALELITTLRFIADVMEVVATEEGLYGNGIGTGAGAVH